MGFIFALKGFDGKTVIPSGPVHVDTTRFHGGSCPHPEMTGRPFGLGAGAASSTKTRNHYKGFVIAVLEDVTLKINEFFKEFRKKLDTAFPFPLRSLVVKKNGTVILVEDLSGLLRGRRVRGAAIPPAIPFAPVLALEPDPGCRHHV